MIDRTQTRRIRTSGRVTLGCPQCRHAFPATWAWWEGDPWPSYVAECPSCRYVILESEWEEVPA